MPTVKYHYARPPFPPALYDRFRKLAKKTGHKKRGEKWILMGKLLDVCEKHHEEFRHNPDA